MKGVYELAGNAMEIYDALKQFWFAFVDVLPRAVSALIALGIGWVAGRLLGMAVAGFIRRSRIDRFFGKSFFGKSLERSGISLDFSFDIVTRWIVYIGSFLVAIDILGIKVLEPFVIAVLGYLPSIIGGAIVFILGVVVVDFVADFAWAFGKEAKVEYAGIFVLGLRFFMYFVITLVALAVMKVEITTLHILINAMAWGLSLGVGAGLAIGTSWIIKDIATKSTEGWMRAIKTTADKLDRAVELDAFRDRVKELESSLAEHEEKIKAMEKVGKMKMEELAAPVADLNSRITELVGEKGTVSSAYGGYRIAVSDPATFPWLEVLVTLINASYDVWFSKEDEEFVIKCKPPSGS